MDDRQFEDVVARAFRRPMDREGREDLVSPILHRTARLRRRRQVVLASAGLGGAAIAAGILAGVGALHPALDELRALAAAAAAPSASVADPRAWVLVSGGLVLTLLAALRGLVQES